MYACKFRIDYYICKQNNSLKNYGPIALPIAIGKVKLQIGKRSYSSVG